MYLLKGRKEDIDLDKFGYYVTGLPRSGTLFYATLLTSSTSDCYHEPSYIFEKGDMEKVTPDDGISCSSLITAINFFSETEKPVIYLDIPFKQFTDSYRKIYRFIELVTKSGMDIEYFFLLIKDYNERFIASCKNAIIVKTEERFMPNTIEYIYQHIHRMTLNPMISRQFSNSRIQLI